MDTISEWLYQFDEWRGLGLNMLTLTFVILNLFSALGAWGVIQQIKCVRLAHAKGDIDAVNTVSVKWSITYLMGYTACFIYGFVDGKLAFVCQGLLYRVPWYLWLVPLLYKAKGGFSKQEWILFGGLAIVLLGMFIDMKNVYLGIMWFCACMVCDQPIQIYKKKSVGAVSAKMLLAYLTSTVFWITYGLILEDWYIVFFAIPFFTVYLITFIVWWIYRHGKVTTS